MTNKAPYDPRKPFVLLAMKHPEYKEQAHAALDALDEVDRLNKANASLQRELMAVCTELRAFRDGGAA